MLTIAKIGVDISLIWNLREFVLGKEGGYDCNANQGEEKRSCSICIDQQSPNWDGNIAKRLPVVA